MEEKERRIRQIARLKSEFEELRKETKYTDQVLTQFILKFNKISRKLNFWSSNL